MNRFKVPTGRAAPALLTAFVLISTSSLVHSIPLLSSSKHETQPFVLTLYDAEGNPIEPTWDQLATARTSMDFRASHRIIHEDAYRQDQPGENDTSTPTAEPTPSLPPPTFIVYGQGSINGTAANISEFHIRIENTTDTAGLISSIEPAVKQAFQVVADAWVSQVPIKVYMHFVNDSSFQAKGRPQVTHVKDDIVYTAAIYDYLTGIDNDPELMDIDITVSIFHKWYLGNDTPALDEYDMQSYLIHETQHGLFLTSNFRQHSNGQAELVSGKLTVFDRFVAVNPINSTEDMSLVCGGVGYFGGNVQTTSSETMRALVSNRLFFQVRSELTDGFYNLYDPVKGFVHGSSVVHWDPFISDQFDSCDRLMYYTIDPGLSFRCIGKITARISFACRTSGLNGSEIQAPVECTPGSFDSDKNQSSEEDDTILGLEPPIFYGIIGGVAGLVLLSVLCITGVCVKRAREAKKRRKNYGYMSPGGYQSAGSPYGEYGYGSAVTSPLTAGSPRRDNMMSPTAIASPTQPSGRMNPAKSPRGNASPTGQNNHQAEVKSGPGSPKNPKGDVKSNPASPKNVSGYVSPKDRLAHSGHE